MKAFKNRNIFERWMAMRLGIVKGAHLLVAPLYSASFGPFLAENKKRTYNISSPNLCLSNFIRRAEDSDRSGELPPTRYQTGHRLALSAATHRPIRRAEASDRSGVLQPVDVKPGIDSHCPRRPAAKFCRGCRRFLLCPRRRSGLPAPANWGQIPGIAPPCCPAEDSGSDR